MAGAVDLSRYRALVRVAGGALLVLVAIDLTLRLAFGITSPALLLASYHNTANRDGTAARVSGVVAEQRHGLADALVVIIGSSSAVDGLVPSILEASDATHHRWLNLAATGSSFDELRYSFEPLFVSGLRADVVVIAVHAGWLAGKVVGDPTLDELMLADLPRTSWILFHRGTLHHLVRSRIIAAREGLLLGMGVNFESIYAPSPAPWRERALPERWVSNLGLDQLAVWTSKRWFDAERFERADDEVDRAAGVFAAAGRVAPRVVVVMMPESTILRARLPASAEAALRRAIARAPGVEVLDLRGAIPDGDFGDHIHVAPPGARRLSALLPGRVFR